MALAALVIAGLPADLLEAMAGRTGLVFAISAKVVGAFWPTFAVYGVLFLITGGISFGLYLHRTKAPLQKEL